MNYLSIYKSIVRRAKREHKTRLFNKKNKVEYYEEHHIIPKSIMLIRKPWLEDNRKKSNLMNKSWNLILLTAREHFLVHRLLFKGYEQVYGEKHLYTVKMIHAETWFINRREDKLKEYRVTSRIYANIKSEIVRIGKSEDNKKKIGIGNKGKIVSEETKELLRIINTGSNSPRFNIPRTDAVKKKISTAVSGENNPNFGKVHTKDWKLNHSICMSGENNPMYGCRRSYTLKIYRSGGRIDVTDDRIVWCVLNGYNLGSVSGMCTGRIKHYRDIIRVEKIPYQKT